MKAMVLTAPDGADGLQLQDRDVPEPGPGEVLVRVRAASLNFRDLVVLKGGYRSFAKNVEFGADVGRCWRSSDPGRRGSRLRRWR